MRILAIVALTASLVGCASHVSKDPWRPSMVMVSASEAQIEKATQAVRDKLRDPDSANFSGIFATNKPGRSEAPVICGFVNAKNAYGGYAGKVAFAYASEKAVFIQEASARGSSLDNTLIRDLCSVMPE